MSKPKQRIDAVVVTVKPRRKKLELLGDIKGVLKARVGHPKRRRAQALKQIAKRAGGAKSKSLGGMLKSLRVAQEEGEFGGLQTLRRFQENYPRGKKKSTRQRVDVMDIAWQGGAPGLGKRK
jgi:hypothetical protein